MSSSTHMGNPFYPPPQSDCSNVFRCKANHFLGVTDPSVSSGAEQDYLDMWTDMMLLPICLKSLYGTLYEIEEQHVAATCSNVSIFLCVRSG